MFLRAQAGAAIPLEAALQPFAPTLEAAGLPLAPRSSLLLQDLAPPGCARTRLQIRSHRQLPSGARGGLRHGGLASRRQDAGAGKSRRIGLPEEKLPVAFLDAPTASGWWAALMRRMEAIAVENQRWSAILQGAALGFDCFKQRRVRRTADDGNSMTVIMADSHDHTAPGVDLNNCDREPIHLAGAVQGFGFLMALSPDWIVRHASVNVESFLTCSARGPAEPARSNRRSAPTPFTRSATSFRVCGRATISNASWGWNCNRRGGASTLRCTCRVILS